VLLAALVPYRHLERVKHDRLRGGKLFVKPVRPISIHQKSNTAPMHAVDRHALRSEAVQGLQHEAVAAERDDDVRPVGGNTKIPRAQFAESQPRGFGFCRDDGNPGRRRVDHPPVTLI